MLDKGGILYSMNPSANQPKPGIPVSNRTEDATVTGLQIFLVYLFGSPFFIAYGLTILAIGLVCLAPAGIVSALTGGADGGGHGPAILPTVIVAAPGAILWFYLSWKLTRWVWKWMRQLLSTRHVGDYQGLIQGNQPPTVSSSARTPRR